MNGRTPGKEYDVVKEPTPLMVLMEPRALVYV